MPPTSACSDPAQPFVAHSTALSAYVMLIVCHEGWFLSKASSINGEDWSAPVSVYPGPEFITGHETDDNAILFSPGQPPGTIGASGLILYARDTSWGTHPSPRSLWVRAFTLSIVPTPLPTPPPPCPPPKPGGAPTCK